ncbi:hypothetical protein OG218_04230 [Kineococcus sp. NBC_00420]|uniref:hypothetical protein n=1 Tax=Kineococcus sp. NBC_00420 TaxID=2903564 RepID=UPI002E2080F8
MADQKDDQKDTAQEHLEKSEELTAEVEEGWKTLPETEEADDAGVQGVQESHAPSD